MDNLINLINEINEKLAEMDDKLDRLLLLDIDRQEIEQIERLYWLDVDDGK